MVDPSPACIDHPSRSTVTAPCGTVHGVVQGGVHVFKGVRFAQAPVGALRFAPPRPVAVGNIGAPQCDATQFGAISLQDLDPLPKALPGAEHNFYSLDARTSEDCLNLNVWTPDTGGTAAVYVYIHGGAFLYGSGTGAWIDGAQHAREHGVVVVTLNYRLGLLGGLWLGDHDPHSSNLGLQDQIEALRWVRANIAAFGGDPDLVTIGGQSAGAMSVAALLCAPAARGLFHRGIIESGHLAATVSLEDARRTTGTVLRALHIDAAGDDVMEHLRSMSALRLLSAEREFGIAIRAFPLVRDGVVLAADVNEALRDIAPEVDLLVGTTSQEDRLFSITGWAPPTQTADEAVSGMLPAGEARETGIALYSRLAADAGLDDAAIGHLIATEHDWATPARAVAAEHAAAGGRTYHYEFAWESSVPDVGAAHLVDLPFFMGNLDASGVPALLGDEVRFDNETRALADDISASVAQFIRTGDLSSSPLGTWPVFTAEQRATMVMDRSSQVVQDRLADRLDFWQANSAESVESLTSLGFVE
ncbi:carboxylesterase/lipase family protein [uncultured Amnibacterium sp.]|uniref:carboxylesterase/lipase family protein n=1 Tax=uncultured Amnibacterium sp. TaxID=1631851 RepID=UPI0035CB9AF3